MGEGTTILETPPYVIALVFAFFLIVTLGFEQIVHLVRHSLQKRGKQGLLAAMGHMQNELMCLGLATLLLLTFQSEIVSYCINAKSYTRTWLDHVSGCSCCLTRTAGVSACYLAAKGCSSNSTLASCCEQQDHQGILPKVCGNIFDPATDWATKANDTVYTVDVADGSIFAENRRHLLGASPAGGSSEKVQCVGRVQTNWPECGYRRNYRPAIGANALHQIHMFIFIIAITHIVMGIILVLLASLRLNIWKKWKEADDEYLLLVYKVTDKFALAFNSADDASKLESQGEESRLELARSPSHGGSLHPSSLPEKIEIIGSSSWKSRPEKMRGILPSLKEICMCFVGQLNPFYLSHQEFSLMRASFSLTHGIKSDSEFKFLEYLRQIMEDDFSQIVGLGLPMWAFIIVFVLLSSAIGWCIWVFVVISAFLLLMVNTKLAWVVRYATRGGNIHTLKPGIFWLNRPWLLLPIVKFLLFFVSYVYANAIFFSTQFGTKSCFFSRAGFQGQPIPWWIVMLINTCFLFSLSLFTLPLFSITVQMGGDYKAKFLDPKVEATAARMQGLKTVRQQGLRKMIAGMFPKLSNPKAKDEGSASILSGQTPSDKAI